MTVISDNGVLNMWFPEVQRPNCPPHEVFRYWQSARVQGQDPELNHQSGHQVPVCTQFLFHVLLGQLIALYSLLSLSFKNGIW